ncbi:tRNA pseudouridine(54/55) synthase Pus10 [Methanobrevibacter sp. OttesenSCG-928-K11]|nr:tRNA pseudouridine(54/55) synthase Pus10 [Methanobrevibacter sp. OttesenSCG-928-K11]MDL2270417.1 tRNA pseudouridine(54/55) synthase Pus10 [Methanobrevibacter sp. OttesenSCG-928-I08]
MDIEILEKAQTLIDSLDNEICNHCLGRKFSNVLDIDGNVKRGEAIRKELNLTTPNTCSVCNNIFSKIDESLVLKVLDKIDFLNIEFETFLVGSKVPKSIIEKDESLDESFDFDVENIKKEINREVGKLLESSLKKEVEFEKQDIVVTVNFNDFLNDNIKVRIQINPIFIEGKYNKFLRGIPQTKWPCSKCKGKGCLECDFTGKQYKESVEELISETVLEYSKGFEAKFHGAGREDIDVLMLGSGRPFVLEIKEPKIRKLDLKFLEKKINEINDKKTAYHNLKFVERKRKAEIKISSPDTFKVYKALVTCSEEFDKDKLNNLSKLSDINQLTPTRVLHRRADKVRSKQVKKINTEIVDSTTFEMIVKTDGGLYIKELISGDNGRTKPSVSDILGIDCLCKQLDVVEVSEK